MYYPDFSGFLHCLDAKDGKVYWTHDMFAAIWGSPVVIDGKVYLGLESVLTIWTSLRVDPGNPNFNTRNIPKVVGGGKRLGVTRVTAMSNHVAPQLITLDL